MGFKFYCRQVPSTAVNVSASTSTDTAVLEITVGHWPFSDPLPEIGDCFIRDISRISDHNLCYSVTAALYSLN